MDNQKKPLITVVTVCYNAVNELEKTMLSVLNQTYDNIEYIVIDGGSKDGTVDIIKKYADRLAYWVSEPDKGIYDAMNKGVKAATGEWINFMNAGDCFRNRTSVETVALNISSNIDIAYGNAYLQFKDGEIKYNAEPIDVVRKRMAFCHQTAFIRSSLHKNCPFDTHYKLSADYNFFFNSYRNGCRFQYIDADLVNYNCREGLSIKNRIKGRKEGAAIRGEDGTIQWKIRFFLWKILFYAKQSFNTILPSYIIYKLKQLR